MISGLLQILFFQGAGEVISRALFPTLPGPVIGLLLLLAWLGVRGHVNEPLGLVADTFSRHLGVLFVPAAVGVVLFLPELRVHALAIICVLTISVVLSIGSSALVLKWLLREPPGDE